MKDASLVLEESKIPSKVHSQTPEVWPPWLERFVDIYQRLNTDNLTLLSSIYHEDVIFIDPLHQVEGVSALHQYFEGLYENLSQCDFVIHEVIVDGNQAAIYWHMAYKHPKLNKGKEVFVSGNSRLTGEDDQVIYHRDYLDVGTMLYEQLPVIGRIIKWIKAKAAS